MMIHKIEPHKYYPEFRSQDPKAFRLSAVI